MNMRKRFEESISRLGCVGQGDRILLAVSGGVDSMVLLDLFAGLAKKRGWEIAVAHVNHMLRTVEAERDEEFVRQCAARRGAPFLAARVDVRAEARKRKRSTEETARILRYDSLERLRVECGAQWIATAHHADDNAETIIAHLIRGTGVAGLRGVHPRQGRILRPLLFAGKEEIRGYAASRRITWREDSTNMFLDFQRNYIRHCLLPEIRALNPGIAATLTRTSTIFRSLDSFLEKRIGTIERRLLRRDGGRVYLAITGSKRYFDFEKYALIQRAIRDFYECQPTFDEIEAVFQLLEAPVGKFLKFRKFGGIFREREFVVFTRSSKSLPETRRLRPGESVDFGPWIVSVEPAPVPTKRKGTDSCVEYADREKAGEEFRLRKWKAGDRFHPLGAPGRKKVSDFLVDRKVPRAEKDRVCVLEGPGGIVWICGMRIDDRVKITGGTRRAWKLTIRQKE